MLPRHARGAATPALLQRDQSVGVQTHHEQYRRSTNSPSRILSESGFTTYRCMTRFSGRAPKIGSYPSFASQSVASSVTSRWRPCFVEHGRQPA